MHGGDYLHHETFEQLAVYLGGALQWEELQDIVVTCASPSVRATIGKRDTSENEAYQDEWPHEFLPTEARGKDSDSGHIS